MEQKQYWDGVSEKKQFTTPFHADELCKYLIPNSKVLDVGCGYGRTLNELHQLGFQNLIGIDFSNEMIERGKRQFPYLDLRTKTTDCIDIPDKSVDAVILFAVLTCIQSDLEQEELVKEIERVLKPNGILYVNDFLLNDDERNLKRYAEFTDKYKNYGVFELPEGAVCRHHEEKWILQLLSRFNKLHYKHLIFTTMNGNKSNGFYFIGEKTN